MTMRKGHSHEMQGRKTEKLLKRTPMTKESHSHDVQEFRGRVWSGPAQVHTTSQGPKLHSVWLCFLTIGIRGQHLKIKGFYIKTRFLFPPENRVSWCELYQRLMWRQGLRANNLFGRCRHPDRGGGKGDSQQRVHCKASWYHGEMEQNPSIKV